MVLTASRLRLSCSLLRAISLSRSIEHREGVVGSGVLGWSKIAAIMGSSADSSSVLETWLSGLVLEGCGVRL